MCEDCMGGYDRRKRMERIQRERFVYQVNVGRSIFKRDTFSEAGDLLVGKGYLMTRAEMVDGELRVRDKTMPTATIKRVPRG